MSSFTPVRALIGGTLIAVALAGMLLGTGRIAGVSGVLAGVLRGARRDFGWRLSFVLGMLVGGAGMGRLLPDVFESSSRASLPVIAAAGLLVGIGTRLANGCTSGHGLCGTSRLSRRSLAATGTFMVTGALTTFVAFHVLRW